MKQYIAIDSGKSNTKIAHLKNNEIVTSSFLTRIEESTFDDDDPGSNTALVEYEGVVYKVGKGAKRHAELSTSKKTFEHKLATLYAIATCCSENEIDEVYAAIGIPVKDHEVVEERNIYREYILPDGEITIRYKAAGSEKIITKTFKIVGKKVYPESIGAVLLPGIDPSGTVAVVDLGHLNINLTIYNCGDVDREYSVTNTMGGNALVTGLSQHLSSHFGAVGPKQIADILCKKGEARCLVPKKQNADIENKSREMINQYLLDYVKKIKDECVTAQWSVDYLDFAFIGGGVKLVGNEIKQIFGDHVAIAENPVYVNAIGFLKIMTGKLLGIDWSE